MIAADTNGLVRFLTNDDIRQSALARELFCRQRIWIAKTVLLETEWVLRKLYGLETSALHLASRPPGARFVTFDRPLLRKAKHAGEPGTSALPLAAQT